MMSGQKQGDRRHSLNLPKKKIFGKNEYLLHNGYRSQLLADQAASLLRAKDFRARVVKVASLAFPYAVYYRPIKGWKTPKQRVWSSRRGKS